MGKSVLIKGVETPKNCHECEFVDILPTCPCQKMANEDFWNNVSLAVDRHNGCPLIEVPTPHGELVDRNTVDAWILTKSASLDTCPDRQNVVERMKNDIQPIIPKEDD